MTERESHEKAAVERAAHRWLSDHLESLGDGQFPDRRQQAELVAAKIDEILADSSQLESAKRVYDLARHPTKAEAAQGRR